MRQIYTTAAAIFIGLSSMFAQNLQETAETLATDPVFNHALCGIKVVSGEGVTLADHNSHKMLMPASNMKLISTGAALYRLSPDYRFCTEIAHDGKIEDGVLKGNLYIIGHGDPTLGSKDTLATELSQVFGEWEKSVRSAGIRSIEGCIVGDGRWIEGMMEEETWLWNDIGTYYGSGVSGLNFYENMISFNASVDASKTPEQVKLTQHYPSTSWMTINQNCTVGEKGSGDKLYMYTSDLAPVAQIRGTYGIDRGSKRVDFSNKFPEYTCAVYFKNYLDKNGIKCSGGAADFKIKKEWKSGDSLKVIGTSYSPTLDRIAFATNHASNNLYAETLYRTLGKSLRGNASYESSLIAMCEVLKGLGLSPSSGLKLQDGSGLSRQNYVSADFMCRFLGAMMDTECFEDFLWSLPYPGGNGTLNYNMKGYPVELCKRIRVKSGSMNGVRCYSGYILPADFNGEITQEVKDKIIIFSILTNNCVSPQWKVRPLLDKFMAEVAK